MTIGHNNGPPIREGNWIAVSRAMIEHHIVGAGNMVTPADKNRGSFSRLESWLDLLSMANYAERKITVAGATMVLRPGQTLAGRAFLAKRWNWSEKAVRVWLAKLETELMITLACEKLKQGQTKGHGPNVLSVCNWGRYQLEPMSEGPDLGRPQGQPGASQGPHYNKETTKQITTLEGARDFKSLETQLLDACNGALDNPVNCQGLLSLATPLMWLDEGADLDRDILPTLRALGQRDHGKRIRTWDYFTHAVAQAKAKRLAGLPAVEVQPKKQTGFSVAAKLRAHRERLNGGSDV